MGCSCCSNDNLKLIYSCSGAANTGELADRIARKLSSDEGVKMTCLAAVGADLSGFKASANSSEKNIVIDGCKTSCGAKIFKEKGLPFVHFITTEFDVKKGETEINDEVVKSVSHKIRSLI